MQPESGAAAIYLDYNATTPVLPEIEEALRPYIGGRFGNPSSDHEFGRDAAAGVALGRRQVADLLGASPDEIVFTSGGSEADNWALVGRVWASGVPTPHLVTSQVEHPAILATCHFLERLGAEITYLPVDTTGRVDPDDVARALRSTTVLVSIMHANNEVGTIQPIPEIAAVCRRAGIPLHSDAAQSVGKIPARVDDLGVDLLTVAGHKLYAPKGVGALYVRRGTALEPLIHGAGHEGGRRAGTENVAWIVGLGAAAELARRTMSSERARQRALRERLHRALDEQSGPVTLNGHPDERLPNTLNLRFSGVDGNAVLAATPTVAASTGSACHAGQSEPSPVLLAMGIQPDEAIGAVRLSLGRLTTAEDIERAAEALGATVRAQRG
ncbi:MAG TPA: cysteine desulfurase family protein [Thermomicrobiaceae bacterium]|nr:cysteine desulfurase family protein [Thermomicrobiaceae bacterium]